MILGGRPGRGAPLASLILLTLVVLFCASTRWGRMYPRFAANSWKVWSNGHRMTAAERRLLFYDKTYPVLLEVRRSTPPEAVVLLPPHDFVKSRFALGRPPGDDMVPLLGSSSSAYGVLYPRVPVMFDEASPWRQRVTNLLVWDWWGLELVDPSLVHTEANRVQLFEAPARSVAAPAPLPLIRRPPIDDRTGPDRWVTPATLLGLVILTAFGDGAYRLLGRCHFRPPTNGPAEGIAWRMLLAPAVVPWLVVFYDLAGIPFTQVSAAVAAVVLLGAGFWALRPGLGPGPRIQPGIPRAGLPEIDGAPPAIPPPVRTTWVAGLLRSPAAVVLTVAAGTLILMSLVHVAILPERDYDANVGFGLVGKILAAEGRLRCSVFERIVFHAQSVYAPFAAANTGFGYLFFEAVPRLWVPWSIGGFLLALGSWVRRRTGSATIAALTAFLVLLPQALLTQSATEARPDLPSMIYTVFAALAVIDLLRGRGGYGPPAMLILVATTARSENVLFGAALATAAFLARPSPSGRAKLVWLVALPAAFFVFWNIVFVKGLIGYDPAVHFARLDFAPARVVEIVRRAMAIIAWPQAFGEFVVVVVAAPLGWLGWRLGRRRSRAPSGAPAGEDLSGTLLLLAGLMFVFYIPLFYAWDPQLHALETMRNTFKRGFFRFMPLLLLALLALPPLAARLRRCDGEAEPASSGRVSDTN